MTWALVFQIAALVIIATFALLLIGAMVMTVRKSTREERLSASEKQVLDRATEYLRGLQQPYEADVLAKIKERYS